VKAGNIRPQDRVVTLGSDSYVVIKAAKTGRFTRVYNFEVADFHTYFVGEDGVWVHNTCPDFEPKLPKAPTGKGSVDPSDRDPNRYFNPEQRAEKRAEQGHKCANGCGADIDRSNSDGHHIDRHADGGRTVSENHAEVCKTCHKYLHSK
jgi:hypothetical protein